MLFDRGMRYKEEKTIRADWGRIRALLYGTGGRAVAESSLIDKATSDLSTKTARKKPRKCEL